MKLHNRVLMVLVMMSAILVTGSITGTVQAQKKSPALKIGTYDSRMVVMAYAKSDLFKKKMQQVSKESEAQLQSKDSVKMKEGALKMISFSYLLERTVFTSASATSTINLVKDEFPGLAQKAGVSLIVSKWDLNYSNPDIEIIDVTPMIVALFDKAGTGTKAAEEFAKQAPMSEEDYGLGESIDMWEQFKAKYQIR
jgi:hypothetical protein